ncbi:unnamed protein product [Effrenium voratum]|nr:unnamed protein product [Effrenium voratum]
MVYLLQKQNSLAQEVLNCTTVQQCSLGVLFLNIGALLAPGYSAKEPPDYWRRLFWSKMEKRIRRLQRRRLLHLNRLQWETTPPAAIPQAEEMTIGLHADVQSASGAWGGQIRVWRAYAKAQRHRFLVDQEAHFTGKVFAKYLGLFWASSSREEDGFWLQHRYLQPTDVALTVPSMSFSLASMDTALLKQLVIFTQPPGYWDSLEALGAALKQSEWLVWIDFDLTISPCCYDSFSMTELIQGSPHIVVRDSPHEDYHHHCANAGFLVVRNTAIGRLFIDLAREKRVWPALPYGYQSALAESLLEILGLEQKARGLPGYSSECLGHITIGRPQGDSSYANYCRCWRQQLDRLAGPDRSNSRWVQFLQPRGGPEVGLLLASYFLHRSSHTASRGAGFLPLQSWSRAKHRRYVEAWLRDEEAFGGPCALLPLLLHWASLPHRPALIYEFLSFRFQALNLEVLVNGSAEHLDAAYRLAAEQGRSGWQNFLKKFPREVTAHWDTGKEGACNLGSERLWRMGGWNAGSRSTAIE